MGQIRRSRAITLDEKGLRPSNSNRTDRTLTLLKRMPPPPPLPPPPPPPVGYASPSDTEYLRWSSSRVVPAVIWTVTMIVVTHLAFGVVTPRVGAILIDFKMELPALTRLLIVVSLAYRHSYLWMLTTPILIAIPLLWLGLATPRPRERLPRLVGSLVVTLLVVWLLLSLLLPLINLYQGMAAQSGKK
jgi:hypothetical protein